MLYLIGIGLNDEKDITVKGLEAVKKSREVYLEVYTSKLQIPIEKLEEFYGKKIVRATRTFVEQDIDSLLEKGKHEDVSLLIIGDALSATTHTDLLQRAREKKVSVSVIHNASVLTAVGITGLQLYKFGKTTSIPFEEGEYQPETPYDVLKENLSLGYHTLLLLDLRPLEDKFMTVPDAIRYMLKLELRRHQKVFTESTMVIGVARLGSEKPLIVYGKAKDVMNVNFGLPVHCLIVPGRMHFMEEEFLANYKL
ncbi:MAG TPA: diphthine synthase [Candidatus Nanoarchaeia archaeon]|nr:diphthine synthase [Candidatus Nanoarchaeia archaeon]